MNLSLGNIAKIYAGYPFRGAIKPDNNTGIYVVQARNINVLGEISTIKMITTELASQKQPNWLKHGDILFLAKGVKHYSVCVQNLPEQTVCSPDFFVIRLDQTALKTRVMPEFINWQLNQVPAQNYFKASAEGTLTLSIRRKVLEDVPITLLPLEKQQKIVKLYQTAIQEQAVLQRLIVSRQEQLKAIAIDVLKQQNEYIGM